MRGIKRVATTTLRMTVIIIIIIAICNVLFFCLHDLCCPKWWMRQEVLSPGEKQLKYNFGHSVLEGVLTRVKTSLHFNFHHSALGSRVLQKCWDKLLCLINNVMI